MTELRFHGVYSDVIAGKVPDNDIKLLKLNENSWGIGFGTPQTDSKCKETMGEGIFLSDHGSFLLTGAELKISHSDSKFTAGYFCNWDTTDTIAYYSAPGTDWTLDVFLNQILVELLFAGNSPGIYGIVMAGKFSTVSGRVLKVSPIAAFRPEDEGRIDSISNKDRFLRERIDAYKSSSFVAAGIILIPDEISLSSGSQHLYDLLGMVSNPSDFRFHLHSIIYDNKLKVIPDEVFSVDDILTIAKSGKDSIISIEHILPTTRVFEAKCFLSPITSIVK